jgi:choice-of-anchor B domain-containing protein
MTYAARQRVVEPAVSDPGRAVRPVAASAVVGEPDIEAVWSGVTTWMDGISWGGETFNGSISKGINFFSSSVAAGDYVPVEIRFSSNPLDQTLCQTFTRPGYASAGVGTFPGSVWDMSNPGTPRRLNICFVEWDDGGGPNPVPDQLWNPNDDGSLNGKREYLFIMNSSYDGTGLTYVGANILNGALDVLYAWWPIVRSGHAFFENEPATLTVTPYYVRSVYGVPGETSITLGWRSDNLAIDSYEIYGGTVSPPATLLGTVSAATGQFIHSGLPTGIDQYYRVEAYDAGSALIGASKELVATPQIVSEKTALLGWWHGRGTYGDCWGYTDPSTNKEYALICARNEGVSIIDINVDPPVEVGFIPSMTPGTDMKDVKIYDHYAIALAENELIQVIDLSVITAPVQVATISPDGGGSHNCIVDGEYLYVVGNHGSQGLEIFSLTNPAAPSWIAEFQPYYYHDIAIHGDLLYACGIYGDGIDVIDISKKVAPELVANFNYPGSGAHNVEISPDGNFAFVGDEIGSSGNHVRVFDVSNLTNITQVADIIVDPSAVTHNCYVKDDLLYIGHYTEGLQVYDIFDPANPVPFGYYDTFLPNVYGYKGAWSTYASFASGKIIISDMQTGLYVIEMTEFPDHCSCPCAADPQCDGVTNVLDVVETVNVSFRSASPITDPDCTHMRTDADCSGATDVIDVVKMVNVSFRSADPLTEFCDPCGL